MEFLRSLLEKKIPLKQAAKRVYARDYRKTAKKSYRKYDPAEHTKITENFYDETGESDEASAPEGADFEQLHRDLAELVDLLAQYDKLRASGTTPPHSGATPNQDGDMPNSRPEDMQFSSFLYHTFGTVLPEDKWNYNERPPQEGPGAPSSVSNVAANTDVRATEPHTNTLASVKKAASQHIKQILGIAKQLGPNAKQQLEQQCAKHCGDKANRVISVLTQAAAKLGVQL